MTALIGIAAALATGFFLGLLLASIYAHAATSRAQERLQRIIRHREAQLRQLRAEVDSLKRGPGTANRYLGPSGS